MKKIMVFMMVNKEDGGWGIRFRYIKFKYLLLKIMSVS